MNDNNLARGVKFFMPDNNKYILDTIQHILDKNKGFIAMSKLPPQMSRQLRSKLGIKSKTPVKILMTKIGAMLEERFIIHEKGMTQYLMTPCDPADLVMGELSETRPKSPVEVARKLPPFTRAEVAGILAELVNAGRVRVALDGKFAVKVAAVGEREAVQEPKQLGQGTRPKTVQVSGEYTQEKFRAAYDELNMGRDFVPIHELRRRLGWPRGAFDQMLIALRDSETIQMHLGDEHLMTRDEVRDSFVNERNYLMGTVTWNVR